MFGYDILFRRTNAEDRYELDHSYMEFNDFKKYRKMKDIKTYFYKNYKNNRGKIY